jgi:hypothetical protein
VTERYIVTAAVDVHDPDKLLAHARRLLGQAGASKDEIGAVGVENALVVALITDPGKVPHDDCGIEVVERWAINKNRFSPRR